jgi:hypothetical protein
MSRELLLVRGVETSIGGEDKSVEPPESLPALLYCSRRLPRRKGCCCRYRYCLPIDADPLGSLNFSGAIALAVPPFMPPGARRWKAEEIAGESRIDEDVLAGPLFATRIDRSPCPAKGCGNHVRGSG